MYTQKKIADKKNTMPLRLNAPSVMEEKVAKDFLLLHKDDYIINNKYPQTNIQKIIDF